MKQAVHKVKKPRGFAVIVTNQYEKRKSKLSQLAGTIEDGRAMDDAFRSLGFATLCKSKISSTDMKVLVESVVTYFGENQPPSKPYCVAFVFSGHGKHKREERKEGDVVCGEDGGDIWLDDEIVKPLAAVDQIGSIPKLFFIDACRGEKRLEKGAPMPEKREVITVEGNYFMAYSTIPKHVAYMNPDDPKSGSDWMQILAKNLKETHASVADVVDYTNEELWKKYEVHRNTDEWEQPETVSRLHYGPVFLHPNPPGKWSTFECQKGPCFLFEMILPVIPFG